MTRILLIASYAPSLRNFRGALIEALIERGLEVHVAAPALLSESSSRDWLTERGVFCHDAPLSRAGLNPVADLRALRALTQLIRDIEPQIFLGYTIKPVIWGLLAAHWAGVPQRVALITGLGYAFTGNASGKRAVLRSLIRMLYSFALRRATLAFFQNSDDRDDFDRLGILPSHLQIEVINGSGVDMEAFTPVPFPSSPPRFLLIARLLGDKGIREYATAAARLKARHPDAEFHLIGPLDANPDSIPETEVNSWNMAGYITWHGALSDVRPAIAASHVYVLPSYREGTPRTVLECMAMGRPIITTDAPGCRETIVDGVNGFMVPVGDSAALEAAMQQFINFPSMIIPMGQRSLEIAQEKYDVRKVNAAMFQVMGLN
jgi:glycosyltransferase involved in cell wall biosynthesis